MRVLSIAAAIVMLVPASARADGIGVAAVATGDKGPVAIALGNAIGEGRPPRVVVDAIGEARAAIAAGAVSIEELQRFRRVREEIDEGWRAYLRVDTELAVSRLGVARTEAEALVAVPGGAALYADAALRLGAVLGHLGRAAEAQAVIALALALDPDRPVTTAEFSPDIVAAVDAVRAVTPPSERVRITVKPPGATIAVDGKPAGRAPIELDLARGQHVAIARAPQFRAQALGFAVDEGANGVALTLERDDDAVRLAAGAAPGLPDAEAQELADATLRFADLDELVLAADTDRRGGPTLLVQRCAGTPARCTAVVELGYADRSGLAAAARAAWQAVRAADLRYPPSVFGDPRVTGTRVEHRCELCRNPFVIGGIGAALVVGTIVVITVVTSSRPPPIVGVDPSTFTR